MALLIAGALALLLVSDDQRGNPHARFQQAIGDRHLRRPPISPEQGPKTSTPEEITTIDAQGREPVAFLVLSASLREGWLNKQLADLAAGAIGSKVLWRAERAAHIAGANPDDCLFKINVSPAKCQQFSLPHTRLQRNEAKRSNRLAQEVLE